MNKKVCLIIGANSEIAGAVIKRFLYSYQFVLCWHKRCDRIKEYFINDNVDEYRSDLRHEENCKRLMKQLHDKYAHIDVIINCIGKNDHCENITEEIWDDVIGTNLKPAFFISKFYWELFYGLNDCKSSGCLIHLSSTAGIRPIPSSPHYIAAKAGLIALCDYFAKVMAPYVRVNTIAPGFVATSSHSSDAYNETVKKIPMQRMAAAEEIAQTVEYIVNCGYVTAQTFVIDGGMIS